MPVFFVHDPKSTSPSTSPSPKLPGQTVRRDSPGGPIRSELQRSHQTGAQVWTIPYRSGGANLLIHPGAHGGLDARLGASLLLRTDASVPNDRHRVGADSSSPATGVLRLDWGPVVARLDAGERLMGPALSEVGWGSQPVGPTSGAGSPMPRPGEAVREASAARTRSGGRKVRRGTSRPGGSPTVPAPRSADLDGRVWGGLKKVL